LFISKEVLTIAEDSHAGAVASALAFIHDTTYKGGKQGLSNMFRLMELLGEPHKKLRCLHVTGTNGKGSVCAFLQGALRAAGYRTGLYTSPYLERFNERIRIDGAPISDGSLVAYTNRVKPAVEKLRADGVYPTEFEITCAIGFLYLAESDIDYAVIEVGLGGRYDSTNVVTPLATAITSVGLDHTKTLGDTLAKIAYEKAGIAKRGVPMILYPDAADDVVRVVDEVCGNIGSPLIPAMSDTQRTSRFGLYGNHQIRNAAVAREMLLHSGIPITQAQTDEGFRRTRWPGRLETVPFEGATFLLDGAHNPHGAAALADALAAQYGRNKLIAITGMLRDKDAAGVARHLSPLFRKVFTVAPDSERALTANELANIYINAGTEAAPCGSLSDAVHQSAVNRDVRPASGRPTIAPTGIRPNSSHLYTTALPIIITGSLYLVGEARTYLHAPECTLYE
jgi:dihydrofolate synthase/folylpolyglutamate synthase